MPGWCHDGRDFLKGVWKALLALTCYFNLKSFSLCLQEGAVHFQHRCVALKQIQRVLPETSQATGWREGCRLENQTENTTVKALCCGFCRDLSGSGWQFGALYHNPSQTKNPLVSVFTIIPKASIWQSTALRPCVFPSGWMFIFVWEEFLMNLMLSPCFGMCYLNTSYNIWPGSPSVQRHAKQALPWHSLACSLPHTCKEGRW